MSEHGINLKNNKLSGTMISPKNNKKDMNQSKKVRKSATVKSNDIPDTLKKNNSDVFKAEKLSSFRKQPRHMSQISTKVDRPDILLGLNEYKKVTKSNRFHNVKKLKASNFSQDLPDTFEPLKGDYYSNIPRPESMKKIKLSKREESKNPEINNISPKERQKSEKKDEKEKNLTDIKENKNETEENKDKKSSKDEKNEDENMNENADKIKELKMLEDERKKLMKKRIN